MSMSILIAEDNVAQRAYLREILERDFPAHQPVLEAGDGEETVAMALKNKPEVCILDVRLPRLSGYSVALSLREEFSEDVGIVFLSGERMEPLDQAAGLHLGGERLEPDLDTQPFWDGCQREQFLVPRCGACNTTRWPPGPMCPECQSTQTDWIESGGRGSVCDALERPDRHGLRAVEGTALRVAEPVDGRQREARQLQSRFPS